MVPTGLQQLPYQKCQAPQPCTTLTRYKPSHPRPSNGASPLSEMNKTGTVPSREADPPPSCPAHPFASCRGQQPSLLNCTALFDSSVLQRLTESFGVEWRVQTTKVLLILLCPPGVWSIRRAQSAAITVSMDGAWQAKWHFYLPSSLLPPTRKTPNHSPILQLE